MKVITYMDRNKLNAGPKAPKDIITILRKFFDVKEKTYYSDDKKIRKIDKIFLILKIRLSKETCVIQYPFAKSKNAMKIISKNNILLIHDLNSIRIPNNNMFKDEIEVISHFKYIIVHNEIMKQYLVEKGINESKIYILELFDYICDDKEKIEYNKTIENRLTVIYAGNLAKNKSPFIYELNKEKMDYTINLYGKGIDESINDKILYKGAFKPEELPNKMNGDIGLIWDGNFDERDQNEGFKNYTKYNNPHKLSCYLAMGVPVIVWEKSAIANLVKKYNVGYTIENLYEINNLNIKDYNEKRKNVKELQNKVINGYYTKRVLEEIIEDIKNEKINN